MNSKELLEQALNTAEEHNRTATRLQGLAFRMSQLEEAVSETEERHIDIGGVNIYDMMEEADAEEIKLFTLDELRHVKKLNEEELNKLLGIKPVPEKRKPAIINQEFEKAVQEMEQSYTIKKNCITGETVIEPDPVEADKPIGKYKKGKQSKIYPENMTVEAVKQMYLTEGKSRKEIGDCFGIETGAVNNFLFTRGIRRSENKSPAKQPDETERP
jgi:hypothetical protein